MAIQEIRVVSKDKDLKGQGVSQEAQRAIGVPGLEKVRTARVYRLEGITEYDAQRLAETLFCEPIDQEYTLNEPIITDAQNIVEVAYKPGVMNPETSSIIKSAQGLGINMIAADSSTEYGFYGSVGLEQVNEIVDRLLINKIVERVIYERPKTLIITGEPGSVKTIPIRGASSEHLLVLSKDKLFLDLAEMQTVQDYFVELGRDPTDCELEIIAARWSEHCGHKTFRAKVIVDGVEKPPLFTRISETARKYFGDIVVSAFDDNSGVMRFYEGQAICGKVETHNSPSAIEPYGGAMTGSGGVFRDVLGTGQGAKVIISTDMFCFAPPDLDPSKLPPGTLHPDYLQRRVVAGVRDYGNRMGIPTNNGSVHYHEDFRAKPTIIVGSYGILPENRAQKGQAEINDLIVAIGGRTGRDGIHGATFSSGEMTDRTINVNSSAVQIGNAIEEKRVFDAILEARDKDLIRALQDCGGGGFSSSIGEIGEKLGVRVNLDKAPLKYQGLAPWEIWVSESQERMIMVIEPKNLKNLLSICKKYNTEAAVLGKFDGSKKLKVYFDKEKVCDLDMEFLHHGLSKRVMEAIPPVIPSEQSKIATGRRGDPSNDKVEEPKSEKEWISILEKVLGHGNVCSKEPIVRLYDHTVQGTSALPPFTGVGQDGPNDAVVIKPLLDKLYGMVVSHGLNPVLNKIDPYWGSIWAAT